MQVIDGELVKIGFSVRPMIWCWLAFAGLLIGCLLARGQLRSDPVSPEPEPTRL